MFPFSRSIIGLGISGSDGGEEAGPFSRFYFFGDGDLPCFDLILFPKFKIFESLS